MKSIEHYVGRITDPNLDWRIMPCPICSAHGWEKCWFGDKQMNGVHVERLLIAPRN